MGLACSLYGVRVEVCSEVKLESSPLRWCSVQRACAVPCFFSRLFRSGSWVFWSLCIFCPAFAPTAHAHSYFQSHIVPSYFVAGGKVSPGASFAALQQGSQIPASLIPARDSTSLFLRSKGLKVSFSETSSCWTGAQTLAYTGGVEVPRWLFQGPVGTWATCHWNELNSLSHHEPHFKLLTPLKDTNLTKRVINKQGIKKTTAIAIEGPRKGRNQGNFLNCWPFKWGSISPAKIRKPFCLGVYFLNINLYMSCCIDPNVAGSISYCTDSALVCQKVTKGWTTVKNHISQGNKRSQVQLRLQIGANALHHFT